MNSEIAIALPNQNQCNTKAYVVIAKDPKGLNVRKGIGRKHSVIARIELQDIVKIKAQKGNWLFDSLEKVISQ